MVKRYLPLINFSTDLRATSHLATLFSSLPTRVYFFNQKNDKSKSSIIINIWQASQACKMNQILRCDLLPERARKYDTAHSGCPFFPHNNFLPKTKRVHQSFLLPNFFFESKKIFCDSLSGWNYATRENRRARSLLEITGLLFIA